jgi:hypothetical protein
MRVTIDDVPASDYTHEDDRQHLVLEDGAEDEDTATLTIDSTYGKNKIVVKRVELRRALAAMGWQ